VLLAFALEALGPDAVKEQLTAMSAHSVDGSAQRS